MNRFQGQKLDCLRSTRPVFRGLAFQVESGGALMLTGPNGSGKSSLLRLMAGLLPPAACRGTAKPFPTIPTPIACGCAISAIWMP